MGGAVKMGSFVDIGTHIFFISYKKAIRKMSINTKKEQQTNEPFNVSVQKR